MKEIKMKLSESTINVLKNFATINAGMQFKEGSVVRTINKGQNVLGKATIKESFEKDFVIYDLNRFLSLYSSLNDPEIVVNADSNNITIKSGTSKTTYGLADESMIVAPPAKELKIENAEVNFRLTKEDMSQVLKLSGILGLPNIAVTGNGSEISISALDVKNADSDDFSIKVGETSANFRMIFVTENLKMVPGTYDVSISSKGISHFKHATDAIEYWIATEAGSKYEG
jgi:hypothetical protein